MNLDELLNFFEEKLYIQLTNNSTKYYTIKISRWKLFYRENLNKNVEWCTDVVQIVISTVNCNSFYFKMETREREEVTTDSQQCCLLPYLKLFSICYIEEPKVLFLISLIVAYSIQLWMEHTVLILFHNTNV